MTKRKIIIDTDPGCDDGLAIISALAYENFDILGIMCVAGNKSLPVVVPNALRLVDFYGKDIPVVKGARNCLDKIDSEEEQENLGIDFHGVDGMGESGLSYSERCLSEMNAWDFLLEKIKENPYEIELITLGPLTNIALAIQKDVETIKKLKSITIMGGSIYLPGNTTEFAEYNIWFDAKAAKIVLNELSDDVKITFVGQDANHGVILNHTLFDLLSYEGEKRGQLVEKIVRTLFKSCYFSDHMLGVIIHDLYTMLSVIDPTIIKRQEEIKMDILLDEKHLGQTVLCENGKKANVVLEFDQEKLKRCYLNLMLSNKEEIIEKYMSCL